MQRLWIRSWIALANILSINATNTLTLDTIFGAVDSSAKWMEPGKGIY